MLKINRIGLVMMILSLMMVTTGLVQAQDSEDACPVIVQTALDAVDSDCSGLERNQACYGNFSIEAQPQADAAAFTFNQTGDIADLDDIQSFTLKGLNTETGEWGVAMLSVQANIPDTLPGSNVMFLLFGDVVLEQTEDNNMQSFYFQNGIGDTGCEEAPPNGILIQTPEGVTQVSLTINGVNIAVGSTAFIQASPPDEEDTESEGFMTINLLEGQAHLTIDGSEATDVTIAAGEFSTVTLDEDLAPVGIPSIPEPYDPAAFDTLPIRVLEREIEIVSLLDDVSDDGDTETTADGSIGLLSGTWTYTTGSLLFSADCPAIIQSSMASVMPPVSETQIQDWEGGFTIENYERQMSLMGEALPAGTSISQPDVNTIRIEFSAEGTTVVMETRAISERLIESTVVMSITEGMSCTITIPGVMEYQD